MTQRLRSTFGAQYSMTGQMLLAGAIANESVVRSVISYVEQDDEHLIPTLTVRETLHYAASLRLPLWMSSQQKKERAQSIMTMLNLQNCADTIIGGAGKGGISKGEKRRVTIGVQLLTEPQVLILDEPTSGLDSFTATSIIDILRQLALRGKTIIFSVHQPRADQMKHFGHILVLARGGHPVYSGAAHDMLPYFSNLGYDCPKAMSPTDFVLDIVSVDLQSATKELESGVKVQSLIAQWEAKMNLEAESCGNEATARQIGAPAELGRFDRRATPLYIAFPILLRRSFTNFRRASGVLDSRIWQVVGFAVIMTLFWAPLRSDYEDIQSRVGFVQQQLGKESTPHPTQHQLRLPSREGLYFVGMLQNIALYPSERDVSAHPTIPSINHLTSLAILLRTL